jgi:hypothetical protein
MPALAQAAATRLLDASLGKAAHVAPTTPMMLALTTTTGTASAAGTEVTGGSYARQNLTTALPAGATNGSITSNAAVNFTGMPAATVTAAEVFDSNGTPRREFFGALAASKTTGAGDTLSFPSGQITLSLS